MHLHTVDLQPHRWSHGGAGTPLQLLEDVMNISSVESARSLFGYLEPLMPVLLQQSNEYHLLFPAHHSTEKLTVLRICNLVCLHLLLCAHEPMSSKTGGTLV